MNSFWKNPKPELPYYAVIFASTKSEDLDGFYEMDDRILQIAIDQPGFLGYETVGAPPKNLFISYWKDLEAIDAWRHNALHKEAKKLGFEKWYDRLLTQICKVEHSNEFIREK